MHTVCSLGLWSSAVSHIEAVAKF